MGGVITPSKCLAYDTCSYKEIIIMIMRSSGNKSAVTIGTLGDDEPLPELSKIFPRPSWKLQACLLSVLINPLMYRVYQILVTIGYILCPIGTRGSFSTSACELRNGKGNY